MKAEDQFGWNARKQVCPLPQGRALSHVSSAGPGQPLLFVHGFSDTSRSFSLLTPHLADTAYIIPDLIGHGQSSRPATGYGLDAMCDDIAYFIEANLDVPPIIVGHSLGAMLAIRLAARRPLLARAIVLIAGTLRPTLATDNPLTAWVSSATDPIDPDDPFFEGWHHSAVTLESVFLTHVRSEAAAMPVWLWAALADEFDRIDLTKDAMSLDVATLMISGQSDSIFGVDHRNQLAAAIRPARQDVLDHCGHNPHWEYPAHVASILLEFSASVTDCGQTDRARTNLQQMIG